MSWDLTNLLSAKPSAKPLNQEEAKRGANWIRLDKIRVPGCFSSEKRAEKRSSRKSATNIYEMHPFFGSLQFSP